MSEKSLLLSSYKYILIESVFFLLNANTVIINPDIAVAELHMNTHNIGIQDGSHLGSLLLIASIIKCGMELLIHSQASTVQLLKFENGYVILYHAFLGMWLLIHAGI